MADPEFPAPIVSRVQACASAFLVRGARPLQALRRKPRTRNRPKHEQWPRQLAEAQRQGEAKVGSVVSHRRRRRKAPNSGDDGDKVSAGDAECPRDADGDGAWTGGPVCAIEQQEEEEEQCTSH